MNRFTKRRSGPLPLIPAAPIAEQQAQQRRDAAWTKKMWESLAKEPSMEELHRKHGGGA